MQIINNDNHIFLEPFSSYMMYDQIKEYMNSILDNMDLMKIWKKNSDSNKLVVIKPNWIQESREDNIIVWEPVITHPQIVYIMTECLAERMNGLGTICICDSPHTYADFNKIIEHGDLLDKFTNIKNTWPDIVIKTIDLRREIWFTKEKVRVSKMSNFGDPKGYIRFNLGNDSLFYGYKGEGNYYGADFDTTIVNKHHHNDIQEYLIAKTPMDCDLFVNLSKLKTHKKTGISCSLKNLVGINGDKNWLPHYTKGSPRVSGDEFPQKSNSTSLENFARQIGRNIYLKFPGLGSWFYRKGRKIGEIVLGNSDQTIRNGNWWGNDTCWRMVLDLNRVLLYGNSNGMWNNKRKNYLTIIDGIIGGEGNGPLSPDPIQSNILIGGFDPAAADAVACKLMGYNPNNFLVVREAFTKNRWPVALCKMEDISIYDGRIKKTVKLNDLNSATENAFKPHFGWRGHIEYNHHEDHKFDL